MSGRAPASGQCRYGRRFKTHEVQQKGSALRINSGQNRSSIPRHGIAGGPHADESSLTQAFTSLTKAVDERGSGGFNVMMAKTITERKETLLLA